jgi:transposase
MGKNRKFSPEYKKEMVERMETCSNISALARETGIKRKSLNEWRTKYRRGGISLLGTVGKRLPIVTAVGFPAPPRVAPAENPLRKQVRELEGKVGRQEMAIDFLKQALQRVEAARAKKNSPGADSSTPTSGK